MKKIISLIIGLLFTILSTVTFAEPLAKKYSTDELIQIIKSEGYGAVTAKGDKTILIKINGKGYLLHNLSDGDLQLIYILSGAKISYEDMNIWNKTKRFSRAYLDSDKDPILESDLLANGGLTEKHVIEFFKVFLVSAQKFEEFIKEKHDPA